MTIWRPMKKILLATPEELLAEVDEGAKRKHLSRSEYIRYILHKEVGGKYPNEIKKAIEVEPWRFADLDDS